MSTAHRLVWLDGRLLPLAEAGVSVNDAGVLTGMGVFESIRVVSGRPFALTRHAARLADGAARLSIPDPGREEIGEAISELLAAEGLTECRVRVTLTAGPSAPGAVAADGPPSLCVMTAPLPPRSAAVSLCTVPFRRNPQSPLAGIKCTAWAENVLALRYARARGADEALLLNTRGELCECGSSNIFIVDAAGAVLTPPVISGCLPGVTRDLVLLLCDQQRRDCREQTVSPRDLAAASEVFITGTFRGIQPVHRIDDRPLSPGPCASVLHRGLEQLHRDWPDP